MILKKKIDQQLRERERERVGIVVPIHNSCETIKRAIESILLQTYDNYEVFLVDDHSTDDSFQICEDLIGDKPNFHLVKLQTAHGAAEARNKALDMIYNAKYFDYVAFLDSDDYWLPKKLESQIKFMKENGTSFSYGDYGIANHSGIIAKYRKSPSKMTYLKMLLGCSVGCLTVMYTTKNTDKIKMPNLKKRNDYALWCLILKELKCGYKYPGMLAVYERGKDGLSSGKKIKLLKYHYHLHRDVNGLNPVLACFLTFSNVCNYALNIFIREKSIK